MAQKNRTKELWLIPKRGSLHQTICLIDGIIQRKYDNTSWKPQKQDDLGVNLKKWGATKNGKNISQQAIRTLVAAIPQYLGFLYINTMASPNTICLTEAGRMLWDRHKDELVKVPNLVMGKEHIITESEIVLRQMEKLQITNPVIQKDCENISLFPFRFLLKVLLKLHYLDQEEIAYFLFRTEREEKLDDTVGKIRDFRKLTAESRKKVIDEFKKTHLGNITLVKAPSAGYFMSLCQVTGIIEKFIIKSVNQSRKISAVKIKENSIDYVKDILENKYSRAEVYDFGSDLQLWIDYIGNPARDYPPITVTLKNNTGNDYLIQFTDECNRKYDDIIKENDSLLFPAFVEEECQIKIVNTKNGMEIKRLSIVPSFDEREFELDIKEEEADEIKKSKSFEEIEQAIIEHCEARNFTGETLNYLTVLKKSCGLDKITDKYLRGAYLEYYFYQLLSLLKEEGVIDEVIWNGKIGKYGLPVQAPGGTKGIPDIAFRIGEWHFVLELTTIKPKSQQFQKEGSSVPDHIRLYKEAIGKEVEGIFCAPVIHERNTAALQATIAPYGINLNCMTEKELIEILKSRDKEEILKKLAEN